MVMSTVAERSHGVCVRVVIIGHLFTVFWKGEENRTEAEVETLHVGCVHACVKEFLSMLKKNICLKERVTTVPDGFLGPVNPRLASSPSYRPAMLIPNSVHLLKLVSLLFAFFPSLSHSEYLYQISGP